MRHGCCPILQEVVKNELVDRGNPAAALIDFDKELTGKGKTA